MFDTGALIAMSPPLYADVMGVRNMPRVLGASYSIQMPVVLIVSPAIGWLRERMGGYTVPWLLVATVAACGGGVLMGLPRRLRDWRPSLAVG